MNGNPSTVERLLLTPRQAAEALTVCERTLYALTKPGEIPAVRFRLGKKRSAVRYDLGDLRAWIEKAKESSEKA